MISNHNGISCKIEINFILLFKFCTIPRLWLQNYYKISAEYLLNSKYKPHEIGSQQQSTTIDRCEAAD